jgi:hypothetical protein
MHSPISGYKIQAIPMCSALLCAWSSLREPNVIPHCSHLNWFADDISVTHRHSIYELHLNKAKRSKDTTCWTKKSCEPHKQLLAGEL